MKLEQCSAPSGLEGRLDGTPPAGVSDIDLATPLGADDEPQSTATSATSGYCGLVQCRKPDCDLSSHRQFVAARDQAILAKKRPTTGRTRGTLRQLPLDDLLDRSVLRIERQIADGFSTLPFKHGASKMFRQLIHHYFAIQIDRLIQIYSPQLDRRTYKTTMMEHALSNDIFCMCITANAKTDMLMRSHTRIPDRDSEIVYAATAYILRQKLNGFKHTDLDWLLVLVVALVGFDLAFERRDNLRGHHQALKQLIALKGGIHTVGHTVSYVLNTDRFLAIFTGAYPLFKQSPVFARLPQRDEGISPYGGSFRRPDASKRIDQRVVNFCLEQCQLVHLMEKGQISMNPDDPAALHPAVIPYFLYARDRLGCEGTCLHADYHENQNSEGPHRGGDGGEEESRNSRKLSKSRCVLLATLILEYYVANANYYTVKGPYLASQLKSVLDRQPPKEWSRSVDMLIWILFVLAAVPEEWEHHGWALEMLKKQITTKYHGRHFRGIWKGDVLLLLRQHVWSNTLGKLFEKTCNELIEMEEQ